MQSLSETEHTRFFFYFLRCTIPNLLQWKIKLEPSVTVYQQLFRLLCVILMQNVRLWLRTPSHVGLMVCKSSSAENGSSLKRRFLSLSAWRNWKWRSLLNATKVFIQPSFLCFTTFAMMFCSTKAKEEEWQQFSQGENVTKDNDDKWKLRVKQEHAQSHI